MKLYIALFKNNIVSITTIISADSEDEAINAYLHKGKGKDLINKTDLRKIEILNYCIFKRKHKCDMIPTIIKDCVINKTINL